MQIPQETARSAQQDRWSTATFKPAYRIGVPGENFRILMLDYLNVQNFILTGRELPELDKDVFSIINEYLDYNESFHKNLMAELQSSVKLIYCKGRNAGHQSMICRNYYGKYNNSARNADRQPYPLLKNHVCNGLIPHYHDNISKKKRINNLCRYYNHHYYENGLWTRDRYTEDPNRYRVERFTWLIRETQGPLQLQRQERAANRKLKLALLGRRHSRTLSFLNA